MQHCYLPRHPSQVVHLARLTVSVHVGWKTTDVSHSCTLPCLLSAHFICFTSAFTDVCMFTLTPCPWADVPPESTGQRVELKPKRSFCLWFSERHERAERCLRSTCTSVKVGFDGFSQLEPDLSIVLLFPSVRQLSSTTAHDDVRTPQVETKKVISINTWSHITKVAASC